MKYSKLLSALALFSIISFGSCKKDYTCTCTTVVGPGSTDVTHSIDDAYANDAKKSCNNYEDQANNSLPGSTTCHL